jgi:hypothetical protein
MSPLQETLDEYLAMRRALGHKLCLAGHLLEQFVAFADRAGATYVTTDLALRHRSAGVSVTGLTAATPSRPAPSTMAPSHPRMPLGWRSERPLALAAVVPDWHVFCVPPLSRFISVLFI